MRTLRHAFFPLALAILVALGAVASAQPVDGIVRGEVIDASGGVLPGVTVTATAPDGQVLATTITDEVGHYTLRGLPPGPVTLTFQLDGFDPSSVAHTVQPGIESRGVERLKLGHLSEQVVVIGKLPLPAVPYRPRPAPTVTPLPIEEMESICQPAKAAIALTSIATIQSHRHVAGRTIYIKGDEVNIDGGTLNGLDIGRNLVVRRRYGMPEKAMASAEHTAGLVQIVRAHERTSTAIVVLACSELMQGDYLAAYQPEPARTPNPSGAPDFDDRIGILFADVGQLLGSPGRRMVIDRGTAKGIEPGQRLTLFRAAAETGKPFVIGEAVVVGVRSDSATIRVDRASDAISLSDWAAPQIEAPVALKGGK